MPTDARRRIAIAYAVDAVDYATGLALSALFDRTSRAVIVWTLVGLRPRCRVRFQAG